MRLAGVSTGWRKNKSNRSANHRMTDSRWGLSFNSCFFCGSDGIYAYMLFWQCRVAALMDLLICNWGYCRLSIKIVDDTAKYQEVFLLSLPQKHPH